LQGTARQVEPSSAAQNMACLVFFIKCSNESDHDSGVKNGLGRPVTENHAGRSISMAVSVRLQVGWTDGRAGVLHQDQENALARSSARDRRGAGA